VSSRALSVGAKKGVGTASKPEERPHGSSPGWIASADYKGSASSFYPTLHLQVHVVCLQEHLTNRDLIRATDAQKREAEEEQRKLFLSAKQKIMQLRKEREKELFK